MVQWEKLLDVEGWEIVLRPNSSLAPKVAILLWLLICAVSLTISGMFFIRGAWMVLPFSGAELLFLGYCLVGALRRCSAQETITITNEKISVQKTGMRRPTQAHNFHKAWARIVLKKPSYRGYPSRLAICSHSKEVEVGRFLVESERKALATKLEEVIRCSG